MTASPTPSCLAVIPARGGSVGVPGKNLADLGGRPLVAHSIVAARTAARVSRVVVSTDDDAIAAAARAYGAEVVRRPAELSGPSASSESALLHVLDTLEATEGYRPNRLCFLQCTSPFTSAADIDGTLAALDREGADAALAVVPYHYFLWRPEAPGEDGAGAVGLNHDRTERLPRQQRAPQYQETGGVYVMKAEGFRHHRHRFFGRVALHEVRPVAALEVDTPDDLARARALWPTHGCPVPPPANLAALVMDFDGVLTDDRVWVDEDGHEAIACHRGDGLALGTLRQAGWRLLILSKERNPVVARRAEKLGIPHLQGIDDKAKALCDWAAGQDLPLDRIAYLGNDLNDLPCLSLAGYALAPTDAHPAVAARVHHILPVAGGRGVIRALAIWLEANTANAVPRDVQESDPSS